MDMNESSLCDSEDALTIDENQNEDTDSNSETDVDVSHLAETIETQVSGDEVHPIKLGFSIFKCQKCTEVFSKKDERERHVIAAHSTVETNADNLIHSCPNCDTSCVGKSELYNHLKTEHSEFFKVSRKPGFSCRICKRVFPTNHDRNEHYKIDHPDEKPFRCDDCGKGFSHKSTLYSHKGTHSINPTFECPDCRKMFKRRDSYMEHMLIHNGPRHQCPHCEKQFVQKSNLVRHIRIHSGEKPYQCPHCPKRFSDKGACNSHAAIHTGARMDCPFCDRKFSRKQKLTYHVRKHTGENLLACCKCEKKFPYPAALREHMLVHETQTKMICNICNVLFQNALSLRRHVKEKHKTGNNIKCPKCTQLFRFEPACRIHIMAIHLQIKPYQCTTCSVEYSKHQYIKDHLKRVHQIDLTDDITELPYIVRSFESVDFRGLEPVFLTVEQSVLSSKIRNESFLEIPEQYRNSDSPDSELMDRSGNGLEYDYETDESSGSEDFYANLVPDVIISEV